MGEFHFACDHSSKSILFVIDYIGLEEEPALDGMPYLTLMYSNGGSLRNGTRQNLTDVDTGAQSCF